MARAPRAHVSKTSGQGISRLSYQKGYALGNKGAQGSSRGSKGKSPSTGNTRSYAKEGGGGFNVEFGGMFDTEDVKELGPGKQPKRWDLERKPSKKMKDGK